MLNAREVVGHCDMLWVTLDTLRYDVAMRALQEGRTPELAALLPAGTWECRHSPASFTYAAHQAFFAGFLPTPVTPGRHPRTFALAFEGSETIGPNTCVFDEGDTVIAGLQARGYHTVCIGGVGFFNERTPLGRVLSRPFVERHWETRFGVTNPNSTEHQVERAIECMKRVEPDRRLFTFINVSALHQPNCIFAPGAERDDPDTMLEALAYVDLHLGRLIRAMRRRGSLACLLMSDHGTAYGEDGYHGHRLAHPSVWTVPYAEMLLERLVDTKEDS